MTEEEIRKTEIKSIDKCCKSYHLYNLLNKRIKYKLVKLIERSITNASIDKANKYNTGAYWENPQFIEIYSNIGYNIKINLDITSSININLSDDIKSYLISHVYYFIIKAYIGSLFKKYKTKLNSVLINKIIDYIPHVNPLKLGYFSSLELNPYINQIYIDELKSRIEQKVEIKYSTMYKCSQCGANKTHQREIQTRSGDEGGTLFITCLNCNHTWRQY